LHVQIGKTFRLDEIADAHRCMEEKDCRVYLALGRRHPEGPPSRCAVFWCVQIRTLSATQVDTKKAAELDEPE
jgi:hypothetical protein